MTNRVVGRSWFLAVLGLAGLLACLGSGSAAEERGPQESTQKVVAIHVRGNQRIEDPAILGRLTLKPGDAHTAGAVRNQIRLIYEMGFFEDVRVETEPAPGGVAVTFVVHEKPFITEIVFDGNEALSDDKLKEKITIRGQSFLDQKQAKESAEKIRLAYQDDGYYNAQVTPIIQALDQDRKRLTFFIIEGERAKIKTVNFVGRTAVTKKELFKLMATREWIWLISNFTDAGVLKREELPNDVERIREVYMNRGYLDIKVGLPTIELTEDKKWIIVTFVLEEGEPYMIGEVGFRGNTVFEDPELRSGSNLFVGDVFQRQKIRDEIKRLTEMYGAKGYAFTDVTPSVTPNPQTKTAALIFHIKEGNLVRVRNINIAGNDKTRDNVIRRELRLNEGEIIDTAAIKRSYQRLNNLNFFETVEILPKQVEEDKVDLDVKVKEKSTGTFSIGGGFSTLSQLMLMANITEGNLFGKGYLARINAQLGQLASSGLITFRNPHIEDSLTSLQLDAYLTQTLFGTFFEQKIGTSATVGRFFSEYNSGSVALFAEQLRYESPDAYLNSFGNFFGSTITSGGGLFGFSSQVPQFITNQFGHQTSTGARLAFTRDTRDFYLDPRTGWRHSLNASFATQYLGGTNDFLKGSLDVVKYTPLPLDTRISLRGLAGVVTGYNGRPIPLAERLWVGGITTMRGFYWGRAGPLTPDGYPEGAAKELVFNADFIFPIVREAKLNGVVFFDYGKGFQNNEAISLKDFKKDFGLEIRWFSPFGPLRVAYGIPIHKGPHDSSGVFQFSAGSVF